MALRAVKRAAERVIGLTAPAIWRRLPGPALVVLTYHRVLPDGHPDRAAEQPGMYVRPETLAMHLATIKEHFEPVHLDDWLEARAAGRSLPRLACAITFDDGWRDNYEFAFPLLVEAAVPATVFLVSSLVGGQYSFWPNLLARQLTRVDRQLELADWPEPLRRHLMASGVFRDHRSTVPDPVMIDRAIMASKVLADADLYRMLESLPPLDPIGHQRDLLNATEIRAMFNTGLVRFGSHTRRHTRLLPTLSTAEMKREIADSQEEISRLVGTAPTLFCYPNGDFTIEAMRLVGQYYVAAMATVRGWNGRGTDRLMIRRIGLHEDTCNGQSRFLARIEAARWS